MVDTRYADCEICGERYHNGDIERYMTESYSNGEVRWVCRHHDD